MVMRGAMLQPDNIYQGDCLDLMGEIPDGSIDCILCDLPYGITACDFDVVIPFEPLWTHYERIIKPRGAIVLTGSQPFTSMLVMSNLAWFRVEWIWEKPAGTNYLNANRDPMKNHENIIVFSDGYPTYNPQLRGGKPYSATRGAVGGFIKDKTVGGWLTTNGGKRYPLTVNKFNSVKNPIHPTEKPTDLVKFFIKTYTNPGELVLDNCIGSGTTAIAAIETGRHWIGIEKDPDYYQAAKERIEARLQQPFLFDVATVEQPKPEQLELVSGANI